MAAALPLAASALAACGYSGPGGGGWLHWTRWLGNGDGTFDAGTSDKWRWPKGNHGSW